MSQEKGQKKKHRRKPTSLPVPLSKREEGGDLLRSPVTSGIEFFKESGNNFLKNFVSQTSLDQLIPFVRTEDKKSEMALESFGAHEPEEFVICASNKLPTNVTALVISPVASYNIPQENELVVPGRGTN